MAEYTIKKRKNINIRISEYDLIRIKSKTLEKGIPYQTHISSLIHKYVKA
jgi:predicted DNA binding CopG/RHH family protein